jgi:gluconokinase
MSGSGCVIGVDMGTTNAKAIALDGDGHEIARATEHVPLAHPEPDAAEQDPRAIYDAVTAAVAGVARRAADLDHPVRHIGLSAAMHSITPVKDDGTPLANALIWMDTRAAEQAEKLRHGAEGKAIYERTGTPIHAMSPLAKLIWLRERRQSEFDAAAKFVSLKEWAWHGWFGEWRVDASIASATGLYNLRDGTWDTGALHVAGITPDRLSRLVPTTSTRRGGLREPRLRAAGIGDETTFTIGASDGVLANLGAGAIGRDDLVLTIGTSLAVRTGTPAPATDPASQIFCYVLDAGRFIAGGASNSGGILLDWLYHSLLSAGGASGDQTGARNGAKDGLAALVRAAGDVEIGDLVCLPYISGERAPIWRAGAGATFSGLRLEHTRAHLVRAAVEGIILNARWVAEQVFARLGRPQRIVATGKVLDADWIRQLTADIFGLPVLSLGAVDASVLGAAALARIASGAATWEEAITHARPADTRTTQPTAGGDAYAGKLERFKALAHELT